MRLIDADNITGAKFHDLPYTHIVPRDVESESYMLGWNDAIDAIVEVEPTIDAVEVVRCRDCKWWDKYSDTHGYCMAAKHGHWSAHWDIQIRRTYEGDFFCADGERKDGDSDDE